VSGDHYQGAPKFNVTVDGKVVATDLVATAVQSTGAWADVTIKGDFAKAPSRVAITFTNDLWSGGSADRNLYIDYIEMNGRRFEGEDALFNTANPTQYRSPNSALMLTNGTVTFDTTGAGSSDPIPAPQVPSPSLPSSPSGPAPTEPPAQTPVGQPAPKVITGTNRANTLIGSSAEDHISGLGGKDKLKAGAGDDILSGGRGQDLLRGGSGDDIFRFGSVRDSMAGVKHRDTIYDWGTGSAARGNDMIDLSGVDANSARGGNQAFKWIGNAAFSGKAGELRAHFDGHDTIVQGNVDADRPAEFQIRIVGRHALTPADFIL
jgi:Ca2+-binding RTX toxin-like protein